MTFDLYSEVTNQVIAMLDKGVVPWRSPILRGKDQGLPQNLESAKPYRGVNVFLLAFTAWAKGYGSSYWLTFNQAKAHGGSIKKGEKSSIVVFWKQLERMDKDTGEKKQIPMLRYLWGVADYVDSWSMGLWEGPFCRGIGEMQGMGHYA